MNPKSIKTFALLLMIPLMVTAAKGQSAYSNLVMSLNPVAYWPLQETTLPPRYDDETNIGSLGPLGNIYYYSKDVFPTNFGAFNDGAVCTYFPSGGNKGGMVPTTDNNVALPFTQQFTVEGWFRITSTGGFGGIVNETGGQGSSGINGTTNGAGWEFVQNFTPYRTAAPNSPSCFSFHVFNGYGSTGGADVEVTNAAAGEWLSGGNTGYTTAWVYMACVFDGTNAWIYMLSTNLASAYAGTNAIVYQAPIASAGDGGGAGYFASSPATANTNFVADRWDPILFAETRSYNGNSGLNGYMQDVAIYTNALTFLQISNHFNAGTNGLGNYQATILGDNPFLHWQMNSPLWANNYNESATYPVANNYGSAASTFQNLNSGVFGANSAIYQPGTIPGYPASLPGSAFGPFPAPGGLPTTGGFGPFTNACAFNGLDGVVDLGTCPAITPTGATNNYSLVAWFKGNPLTSMNGIYQCIASHGDSSWKAQVHYGTVWAQTIGSGNSAQIAPPANYSTFYPNDGNWHMYTLVATYTNNYTNVTAYLDFGAYSATSTNPSPTGVPGANTNANIGGDPDIGQYANPTNNLTFVSGEQVFAGLVAHVAFFPTNLTLTQIQNLYFTGSPGVGITGQPKSANVNAGLNFTNTVAAIGISPTYQWYQNGGLLGGQTSSNLVLDNVSPSDDGSYYAVVSDSFGSVTSSMVSLSVYTFITIQSQGPQPYTNLFSVYPGTSPTFSVAATGPLITYNWYTNNVLDSADAVSNLQLTNVQAGSTYSVYCHLANSYSSTNTMTWGLQVLPYPPNSGSGYAYYPLAVLADDPIAYWRMNDANLDAQDNDQGDNGYICNDYINGDDGIYTNAFYLGSDSPGYDPVNDPSDSSATFDQVNSCVQSILAPDMTIPNGSNAEFTVMAWINPLVSMAGENTPTVVAKGGYNQEEFTIDCGASGSGFNNVRFEMHNASGTVYNANSSFNVDLAQNLNQWTYVAGVCDEANGLVSVYVNGLLAGTVTIPTASGVINTSQTPLTIGSRSSSDTQTTNNEPFDGSINDVAIFNYAMTSNQIAYLYSQSGNEPEVSGEPTNIDADYGGGTTLFSSIVYGATNLQWYEIVGGNPVVLSGQTNATLVVSNLTSSTTYELVAYDIWGTSDSSQVTANVINGLPLIYSQPQSTFVGEVGGSANNSVTAYGIWPLGYQWQYSTNGVNWVNVSGYRFSGQSNPLTISDIFPGDAGYYQCIVTDSAGSSTSSSAQFSVLGVPLTFNTNGANGTGMFWTGNGGNGVPSFATNLLTLTVTNSANNAGTATYFYQIPQYIGAFEASFTYEALYAGSQPMADGVTFCLQDDPRGASALGLGGGDLAVLGNNGGNLLASGNTITPSVELELNIYPNNGVGGMGYSLDTDGTIGPTVIPGSVQLTNVPVDVTIYYANGRMALTFSNEVLGNTYNTSLNVGSLPQILGTNTALVGFTGSYGGDWALQTITNFTFVSLASQTIAPNGTNVVVSWPASIAGYTLQESSSLTSGNWVNVTNPVNVVNGSNEVIVPQSGPNMYYRLILL